jgi:hypothetical protein
MHRRSHGIFIKLLAKVVELWKDITNHLNMKENMIKTCKHCNIEFNLHSRLKKQVGGYINECPDCVEELGGDQSEPKHFGVTGSAGAPVKIIKFDSHESRSEFQKDYDSMKNIKDLF